MSSSFRDLLVWRRGMEIAEAVYRVSGSFPKAETYGLTGQLRRAVVSVPSNLAEGHMRASTKEYLHHVAVAQGSLAEVETQLELALRLSYARAEDLAPVLEECVILSKQLRHLRDSLGKRTRPNEVPNPQSLIPNPPPSNSNF